MSVARCLASAVWMVTGSGAIAGQASGQRVAPVVEEIARDVGAGVVSARDVERGEAVVRLVNTEDNRDVALFGVVLVRASREAVTAHVLGLGGVVVTGARRFGMFSDPPTGADVREVSFDRSEYKGLRTCRKGDCDFKLSRPEMESYINGVSWSSPNAKRQADDLLRRQLLQLVAGYRQRGDAAMPTYDDGHGVRSADAFAAVLEQAEPTLAKHAPALLRYLTTYPSARPDEVHDFVYWSEERRSRMRPTLTVNHVVAYVPPRGTVLIARKQIYASHYFEAGLELFAVVEGDVPGMTYLVAVRRFRFDHLPVGIFNVRGRVRSSLVEATRLDLTRERTAIERPPVASRR